MESKQPQKQRLKLYKMPLHKRHALISAHLSKELAKNCNRRSMKIRKGDRVKIVRGEFKNKSGKITKVDLKLAKVQVEGVEKIKKDGTKIMPFVQPSNLIITELDLEDKRRKKILERKKEK